jgi:nicotinate-nucleotide adenylyltransferase
MFDPVHLGHLQLAQQVRNSCGLDSVRLIPAGNPVHRDKAAVSAESRIGMLDLAVANEAWLQVDDRECRSPAPSYTFDTLAGLRSELPDTVLYLLMGLDAFIALQTWYRWQELFTLAHVVVVSRPGYALTTAALAPVVRAELDARLAPDCRELSDSACGRIWLAALPTPPISSSQVRQVLRAGGNTQELLHPAVAEFIRQRGLYQGASD